MSTSATENESSNPLEWILGIAALIALALPGFISAWLFGLRGGAITLIVVSALAGILGALVGDASYVSDESAWEQAIPSLLMGAVIAGTTMVGIIIADMIFYAGAQSSDGGMCGLPVGAAFWGAFLAWLVMRIHNRMQRARLETIKKRLRATDAEKRVAAVQKLRTVRGRPSDVYLTLAKCLDDDSEEVQRAALGVLSTITTYDFSGDLPTPSIIEKAAIKLKMVSPDKEPLIEALQVSNQYLCRAAIVALGQAGGDEAVEPLKQLWEDDSETYHDAIIEALKKIGARDAVVELRARQRGSTVKPQSDPSMVIHAMIGICVNEPKTYVEPPSNVRRTATIALSRKLPNASLAQDAKVGFFIRQGGTSFQINESQAVQALPKEMQRFMTDNGLDPHAYQIEFFAEELGDKLMILWAAAKLGTRHPTFLEIRRAHRGKEAQKDQKTSGTIRFVRTDKQPVTARDASGTFTIERVYKIHEAPDSVTALDFLARHPVERMHEYLVVETPEGNFGRDITGIFNEADGSPISSGRLEAFDSGTLVIYVPETIQRGMWLGVSARAVAEESGQEFTAMFFGIAPQGKVVAAVFAKLPVGRYRVRIPNPFGAARNEYITINPAQVTELKPFR